MKFSSKEKFYIYRMVYSNSNRIDHPLLNSVQESLEKYTFDEESKRIKKITGRMRKLNKIIRK